MHNLLWALALTFLVIGILVVLAGAYISGAVIVAASIPVLVAGDKVAHDHGI